MIKAVFPVAGLGTRFLPATKAQPKEMLPVVDKPLIQYAVEEAYAAGVRQMIFVTGRNKRSIEDHFDVAFELETDLRQRGKDELLALVHSVKPDDMECVFIRQAVANGLGAAVGCAESVVGDAHFLVLLADDLLLGEPGVCTQLVEAQRALGGGSVIAVERVPEEQVSRYGIVAPQPDVAAPRADAVRVQTLVEKPAAADAPSNLAILGRYLLAPRVFHHIRQLKPGRGGELQLTDALAALAREEPLWALSYKGRRFDCGSKLGYVQANLWLGMQHADVGTPLSQWIERGMP
jgi:UTP--glucose-1-phosphate uridylyltransferase